MKKKYKNIRIFAIQYNICKHNFCFRFDQANLNAIHNKLKEFNSKVGDGLNAFTDEQLENIVKLGEMVSKLNKYIYFFFS